jgi:secreted trypsin-like serine protease
MICFRKIILIFLSVIAHFATASTSTMFAQDSESTGVVSTIDLGYHHRVHLLRTGLKDDRKTKNEDPVDSSSNSLLAVEVIVEDGSRSLKNRILKERIVGGTNVTSQNEFPSFVDLDGCGGTLIDKYFVLTAAHCVDSSDKRYYREYIRLGGINDKTGSIVRVAKFIIHPLWDTNHFYRYDMALLRLACASRRPIQRLNFNGSIPMEVITALRPRRQIPQPLVVIGEGRASYNGTATRRLQKVTVDVVPTSTCGTSYIKKFGDEAIPGFTETNNQLILCAGKLDTGGKDSCKGDSGGPLYIMMPRGGNSTKPSTSALVPVQVGIVSFGEDCGLKDFPGIYTRVSAYEKFITETIAIYYTSKGKQLTKYCKEN